MSKQLILIAGEIYFNIWIDSLVGPVFLQFSFHFFSQVFWRYWRQIIILPFVRLFIIIPKLVGVIINKHYSIGFFMHNSVEYLERPAMGLRLLLSKYTKFSIQLSVTKCKQDQITAERKCLAILRVRQIWDMIWSLQ